jgi:hypothetical protein
MGGTHNDPPSGGTSTGAFVPKIGALSIPGDTSTLVLSTGSKWQFQFNGRVATNHTGFTYYTACQVVKIGASRQRPVQPMAAAP